MMSDLAMYAPIFMPLQQFRDYKPHYNKSEEPLDDRSRTRCY